MNILFDDLKVKLFEFRQNNRYIISNYIFQDFSSRKITLYENENGFLIFVYDKEYDIYKVFYMVSSLEALDNLFLKINLNKKYSLEIIDNKEINLELEKILNNKGFEKIATLKRMSFLDNFDLKIVSNRNIEYCDLYDIKAIKSILKSEFDIYRDSLPSLSEIKIAIEIKSLIKVTDENKILGFLWFDKKKIVTELRYLYIDKEYRGKGLSKELMEQYLHLTNDIKKKQLWVLSSNHKAINLYKKYGYSFEELKDIIFKK